MAVNKPKDMYERYKLCPDLILGQKCFRVQRYNEGNFDEVFHEHVPSHRISLDSELEVLRVLAGHYTDWSGTFILHSRLNKRRGGPSQYPVFTYHFSYPEEGTIRRYVSSGDVSAWSDTVIVHSKFCQDTTKQA